jgi:Transposase DNA-binding
MLPMAQLLAHAPLGDKRLNRRALQIVESLIQGHTSATHGTQGVGHAEPFAHVMGSFRFFDNDRLKLPALYEPCKQGVAQQIAATERCFLVHDISTLDYGQHQSKEDLIRVGNERGYGYDLYSALALNATGRPLGPVVQELRTTKGCLSSESDEPLRFVDHLSQVERGARGARLLLPERVRIHLLDREFDDLQLLRTWQATPEFYVIRCQHLKRRVLWGDQSTSLLAVVDQVPLQAAGALLREGQHYDVFLGETRVLFAGKSLRGVARKRQKPQKGLPLSVRVVISELRLPGHKPLRWVLLTNLTDPCAAVVQAYSYRWRVERFFYLNKVGFRLEQWRQENGDRMARRLALTQLAALALYLLLKAADTDPELAELVKIVATVGGWLGRKHDPLGPIVLMRGMTLLLGMMRAMEEFGEARLNSVAKRVRALVGIRDDD